MQLRKPPVILVAATCLLITASHWSALSRPTSHTHRSAHPSSSISHPTRSYGYVHEEVATITDYIMIANHPTPIGFRADSNRRAVDSLRALKPAIFLSNSQDGKSIFLVCCLHSPVKHTPSTPNMLQSQAYQEFTLQRWYILTPFVDCVNYESASESLGDEKPRFSKRSVLKRSDFTEFPGLRRLDLRNLARPRAKPAHGVH